jgi:hypothetical protein
MREIKNQFETQLAGLKSKLQNESQVKTHAISQLE